MQSLIGPHAVYDVDLESITFPVKLLVDHVPALRLASEIRLHYTIAHGPSLQEYTEIVSFFERPKRVAVLEIPTEALVVFLGSACASKLKKLDAIASPTERNVELSLAQENTILRSCFDFFDPSQGEPKHFVLLGWNLRWDFLRRLIE
ncbi:hypothetical protein AAVH_37407, partial [Aphelenchoides avenae]